MKNLPDTIDLVVSLGGDGTFNEVVTGNMERKNRLLICHIPVGTTNDVGAMFGYGKDPVKNVSYETPRELKSKYGQLAYLFEGAKNFVFPTPLYSMKYVIDGKEYSGQYSFMLISNANRIAGINNFYKDIKLDDNKFEIILCNLTKKSDIVRSLYYLATSNITQAKGFEFHRLSSLEIVFDEIPKNAWCVDGEKLDMDTKKYNISIINDFKILMPKKNVKKLFSKRGE